MLVDLKLVSPQYVIVLFVTFSYRMKERALKLIMVVAESALRRRGPGFSDVIGLL